MNIENTENVLSETSETSEQVSFVALMSAIDAEQAKAHAIVIATAIDDRASYELAKNSENDSIQKHLKSARSKLATSSVARFFLAANIDVAYINVAERVNARRNVYAVLKLADLSRSVCFNDEHNAITRACLRSLFAFSDNDVTFTHKHALMSASNKVTVDATARKYLTRHTVSASTASTQASSSMSALVAANVCSEYRSESNETAYRLNDNALVTHLRSALAS